jgi:hypothetical protein
VAVEWVWQTGGSVVTALGLVVCTEAVSRLARWFHIAGPGWGLDHRVTPDNFEAFVAAMVGSLAAFLALFFTTLGVVAATAYANVPGEVRAAFLRGRQNAVYVATVVRALMAGILLLAAHIVGYHPYALTVLLFAVLSLLSVLGSAALGVGLFGFFDLVTLAEPLPDLFIAAVVKAAVPASGTRPDETKQTEAYEVAERALRLRRQVLAMIAQRDGLVEVAPAVLSETMRMWNVYAQLKATIPSNSAWFRRQVQATNWLAVNPFELRDPVTQEPVRVNVAPDSMWIERELAEQYTSILRPLVRGEGWEAAMDAIDVTSLVAGGLVANLNIDEALLLCRAASAVVDHVADTPTAQSDLAPDHMQRRRFRNAAVQAGSVVRSRMWHGLSIAARHAASPDMGDHLEGAAHAPNDPEIMALVPVPRNLRAMLDAMALGLALEREAEGHEISPAWWLRHLTAHTLARALFSTADELLADLHAYLAARHAAVQNAPDPEVLVTMLLIGLEALGRAELAVDDVETAGRALAQLEPETHSYDAWPVWKPDRQSLAERRSKLLGALGGAATKLPARRYSGDEPDLLGRSYSVVSQALFDAILDGEDTTASALFPAAMQLAQDAHERASEDVSEQPQINHLIRAVAPLIDMMLISGYALFFNAFDGSGIWPQVQAYWDAVTTKPDNARTLVAALEARHHFVAGDASRMGWQQKFARWLEEHGLSSGIGGAIPSPRSTRKKLNPLVRAVVAEGPMTTYLMADLFRFEYLAARPGGADQQPGPSAELLRKRIIRARRSQKPDAEVSDNA